MNTPSTGGVRTASSLVGLARVGARVVRLPSPALENAYYVLVAYSIVGQVVVTVPFAGAAVLAALAFLCLSSVSWRTGIIPALVLPVGCALSFVAVQLLFHDQSLLSPSVRIWVTWIFGLVAVQCLAFRPGFLHRFALAALAVGLCLLPYMDFRGVSTVARIGVEQAGLSNPNSLGMWFGFCAVYFVVRGMTASSVTARSVSWAIAIGCLYLVGRTVSRGPLLGVAIATVIASRELLRRGFLPLLLLVVLSWVVVATGMFNQILQNYEQRGLENTGRTTVWPEVIQRIREAPLVGVSVENAETVIRHERAIAPHNGLLYILLTGGAIPALFFAGYWIRAARALRRSRATRDRPFLVPLFVFAMLEMMILDTAFMSPWHLVVLCSVIAGALPNPALAWRKSDRTARPSLRLRPRVMVPPPAIGRGRRGFRPHAWNHGQF